MTDFRIQEETTERAPVSRQILDGLLRYNESRAGSPRYAQLVLSARDGAGKLVGGLVAMHSWNGLFIDYLWVDEGARRRGLGTDLMKRAEAAWRERGGEIVFLSTYSFQAPGFYENLGYAAFGTLEGVPPGASRTWYWKRLTR